MKTIQELNSKWYWRLIKVVYMTVSLSIVVYLIIFLLGSIYNYKETLTLGERISQYTPYQGITDFLDALIYISLIGIGWLVFSFILLKTAYYIIIGSFNPEK